MTHHPPQTHLLIFGRWWQVGTATSSRRFSFRTRHGPSTDWQQLSCAADQQRDVGTGCAATLGSRLAQPVEGVHPSSTTFWRPPRAIQQQQQVRGQRAESIIPPFSLSFIFFSSLTSIPLASSNTSAGDGHATNLRSCHHLPAIRNRSATWVIGSPDGTGAAPTSAQLRIIYKEDESSEKKCAASHQTFSGKHLGFIHWQCPPSWCNRPLKFLPGTSKAPISSANTWRNDFNNSTISRVKNLNLTSAEKLVSTVFDMSAVVEWGAELVNRYVVGTCVAIVAASSVFRSTLPLFPCISFWRGVRTDVLPSRFDGVQSHKYTPRRWCTRQ